MSHAESTAPPTLSSVGERLVGAHEIAKMFDVSRQSVHDWSKDRARTGFPEPWDRIKAGAVWRTEDVRAWAKKTGRRIHE